MDKGAPPAFPTGAFPQATPGMTLRDYFAGQALAGVCANYQSMQDIAQRERTGKIADHMAYDCYVMADAMLAAREVDRG